MLLTDDTERHGVLGGASSVPHHHCVGASVGCAHLGDLQTAVRVTVANGEPPASNHHLTDGQTDVQ